MMKCMNCDKDRETVCYFKHNGLVQILPEKKQSLTKIASFARISTFNIISVSSIIAIHCRYLQFYRNILNVWCWFSLHIIIQFLWSSMILLSASFLKTLQTRDNRIATEPLCFYLARDHRLRS